MHRFVRPLVHAGALSLIFVVPGALACTLGDWSSTVGAQGLSVGTPGDGLRRYEGRCGLQVRPGSSPRYVQDTSPQAEPEYLARFYLFAGDLELNDNGRVEVFTALRGESRPEPEFGLRVQRAGDRLALVARARDGSRFMESEALPLRRGWRGIELHWRQASGPSNGELLVFVDGTERAALSGLANRDGSIDLVRLGAIEASGAGGSLDFDGFVSHRGTPVGLLTAGDVNGDGRLNAADAVALVRELKGQTLADGQPDCNGDGVVDDGDLECLAESIVRQ